MLLKSNNIAQTDGRRGTSGQQTGVAALLIIYILYGLALASSEYRVLFLQSQGLTATECGRILAAASLLAAISYPLAGALADKLHSRRLVCIGALLAWVAVLALLLFTRNVRLAGFALCAGIVPLLSVSELSYGMVEASGVTASLMYPKLDYSLIRVCLSIGYSAINFVYTPIVNRFGPTAPFYCTILYVAIMLALSGTMRKFETAPEAKPARGAACEKLEFRKLFKNYFLISFVLLNFVMALGSYTQQYLVYLIEDIGMDGSLIGIATGIRVLGEIITMPLVPLLKRRISLPMLQVVACLFRVLQLILFITCKSPYVIIGVVSLSGIAGGITLGTTVVYLRHMAPTGLDTTTLSLNSAMNSLGAIVMGLVGGKVVDSLGIFALYRISLCFLVLWLVLYFGTWAFGVCVLKKTPPTPMFKKNQPLEPRMFQESGL